jgi:hypothetical protein
VQLEIGLGALWSFGVPAPSRKIQHMEDGYTQLGTLLPDQRPDAEEDGVIVVGRFKGDPYDGVQLSYEAGRRNLYLTQRGGAPGIPAAAASKGRHPVRITRNAGSLLRCASLASPTADRISRR